MTLDVREIASKVANAMRNNYQRFPAPAGYQEWAKEYFKQPACGEVLYEAPIVFTLDNPQEAIEWYESYVGPLPEDEKKVLLRS